MDCPERNKVHGLFWLLDQAYSRINLTIPFANDRTRSAHPNRQVTLLEPPPCVFRTVIKHECGILEQLVQRPKLSRPVELLFQNQVPVVQITWLDLAPTLG